MAKSRSNAARLPKGVTELPRPRGGRRFRASIRNKGNDVHLGLYETPGLAAFAFNLASEFVGRGARRPNEIASSDQPTVEQIHAVTRHVKMRLGLLKTRDDERRNAPSVEELLTFFEVTVVGFWQIQAAMGSSESAEVSRLRAASRIYDAALLLFHERDAPIPLEVMTKLLSRRLDREFRNSNLARDVLLDDGDEPLRVAEWLARPDDSAVDRGFREEIQYRYPDHFEAFADTNHVPDWIHVLGLSIPFTSAQLRDAYRTRSRTMHPDAGGSHDQFVRLNHAYETARQYLRG